MSYPNCAHDGCRGCADCKRTAPVVRGSEIAAQVSRLTIERDNARAIARVLAHAYEHDSRPPANMVAEALAFPVFPAKE